MSARWRSGWRDGFLRAGASIAVAIGAMSMAPRGALAQAPAEVLSHTDIVPDQAIRWPDRLKLKDQREGEMGVVLELPSDAATMYALRHVTKQSLASGPDIDRVRNADGGPWVVEVEHAGSLVFVPVLRAPGAESKSSPSASPANVLEFVSARDASDAEARVAKIERTWFSYYEPGAGTPAKGLVLLMPGIFGEPRPVIERLIAELRKQSWGVLRMHAQSSRFTENITLPIDLERPEPSIDRIAGELTQRVGECAYAVQSATAWCERAHPELAKLPRFAIGMSGGAMTLPSILARDPERYTGAVMIAGGAEWLSLTDLSVYKTMIRAVDFAWSKDPTDDDRRKISGLYLKRCALDSYHTAALLKGKRLLMIHGTVDMAVPAVNGDLLWRRLGEPERWNLTAGHELVFAWVNRNLLAIAGWIDGKDARPADVQ